MEYYYQRRRTFILSLLVLFAASMAMAAPRSVQQARQEVLQLMNKQSASLARGQKSAAVAEPRLVFSKAKKTPAEGAYYYVFSAGKGQGFAIASGDDRLPAIIGYTVSGDYDADNLPVNFVSFMQAYQDYVDNASDTELAQVSLWRNSTDAIHEDVDPLMKSTWGQSDPYDIMCPLYKIFEGRPIYCSTGCVATAMAQILYYYKHPVSLQADIPVYDHRLSAISAGEIYDWDNMLDNYAGKETETQNNAVAKLMLHVGCAVKMSYGLESSASTGAAAEAFSKYFGMDKDLEKYVLRGSYDIEAWDGMLYHELIEGRPVFYEGQSTGGGHAFVVHGYSDGLYYVNWGWNGWCDGYFDITILNPNSTAGIGASNSDDGYSMNNGMIIGIQPDNGIVDDIQKTFLTSYNSLTLSGGRINGSTLQGTVKCSPFNTNLTEGSVSVSIGYQDSDGSYIKVGTGTGLVCAYENLPPSYYYPEVSFNISFQFEENKTYRLCLIESQDQVNWRPCDGEDMTALTLQVQNGSIVIPPAAQPSISGVTTLNKISGGYATMKNRIDVTVTNTGDREYYDRVYVLVSNTNNRPNGYTYAAGITAPVGGNTTFTFNYTPMSAGIYNFWILDADLHEIGKSSIEFMAAVPPSLAFVSVTCDNLSEDKTVANYLNQPVEMKKVYDTQASFTFEIRNHGGYYEGDFGLWTYNNEDSRWDFGAKELTIPADTTIVLTFTAEGSVGDVIGFRFQSTNSNVSILGLPDYKQNMHFICDENGVSTGSYYPFVDGEIVYLADSISVADSTAVVKRVKAADTSLDIAAGQGIIIIKANADIDMRITDTAGVNVARLVLNAGEQKTINLPAGVYIVNRRKVIVR